MTTLAFLEPESAADPDLAVTTPRPLDHDMNGLPEDMANMILQAIPPMWPLKDFVAVNPFTGLTDRSFMNVQQMMSDLRGTDLLMDRSYFQEQWRIGRLTHDSLNTAVTQCGEEYPSIIPANAAEQILAWLQDSSASTKPQFDLPFSTVASVIDQAQGTSWTNVIVNEISRQCAAHFDEGQATWPSPWRHLPLYEAWRARAVVDKRLGTMGMKTLPDVIAQLPAEPMEAVADLLRKLNVPAQHQGDYALMELFTVAGWASFLRYRVHINTHGAERDLLSLLAMRLAYDVALEQSNRDIVSQHPRWSDDVCTHHANGSLPSVAEAGFDIVARYVLQLAMEIGYRQELAGALTQRSTPAAPPTRKTAQMVFCIDVRSEVIRRHLETIDDRIQTMGFAGFFGMSISYVPLGESDGVAQCPVLLTPAIEVKESVAGDESTCEHTLQSRQARRLGRKVWKRFQTSAASCFSFVESLGIGYVGRLLADSLRLSGRAGRSRFDGVRRDQQASLGPQLDDSLTLDQRVAMTEGMLRNLGLTENLARLVVLCGHGSSVSNNPFKASLECGACGGHAGEPNARVAAMLLNQPEVREELNKRGIAVPNDTWFLAGVHDTTSDQIRFCDAAGVPASHHDDFVALQESTTKAAVLARAERAPRLRAGDDQDVMRRTMDWCELRPEWGLAGNAAFVVARRQRTKGLDLGGRVFLHDYQYEKDAEHKVLELIMTAPMVVANWINMQYYASSVAPDTYGSGNKAIHNVVGCLGVMIGNGGDLATGLPWQSVHDGERLQHEPIRLQVFIEAPRDAIDSIISKHDVVRHLVDNGWVYLTSLEGDEAFLRGGNGEWNRNTELAATA